MHYIAHKIFLLLVSLPAHGIPPVHAGSAAVGGGACASGYICPAMSLGGDIAAAYTLSPLVR